MPKTIRRLWILIYNSGRDNEGIYARFEGGKNTVVAFETEDDALRYSIMLEAQDFPEPKVERIDEEELEEFCRDSNLGLMVVNGADLAVPPSQNIEETDWQKDSKNKSDRRQNQSSESETEAAEFSQAQLDALRRRFEGLL
jgi:Protein of unknown function (DUF3110)